MITYHTVSSGLVAAPPFFCPLDLLLYLTLLFSYSFIVWLPKFFDCSVSCSTSTPNSCDTQAQLLLRTQLLFKKKSKPSQQQHIDSCISNDRCKIVTTDGSEKQKISSKSVPSSTLFILLKEVITKQTCSHRVHQTKKFCMNISLITYLPPLC